MSVSRQRRTPLYLQLYESLRAQLQCGDLPPGGLVPAESELMRRYRVSRITVRSALEQLAREGLIVRQRGRGTFVRSDRPEERRCLSSFTEQMLREGRRPVARLLRLERLGAAASESPALPFEPDEELVLIERLREVDGEAAALVRSFIPARHVPGIRADHFVEEGPEQSLLHVLEHRFGVVLHRGEETLSAACLNRPDAERLRLPAGAAVVLRTCLVRNVGGEPLLFEQAFWCTPQTHPIERRLPVVATG